MGCLVVSYNFIQISIVHSEAVNKQQTPRSVASDLVLRFLPMFNEKDGRLEWVNCVVDLIVQVEA